MTDPNYQGRCALAAAKLEGAKAELEKALVQDANPVLNAVEALRFVVEAQGILRDGIS